MIQQQNTVNTTLRGEAKIENYTIEQQTGRYTVCHRCQKPAHSFQFGSFAALSEANHLYHITCLQSKVRLSGTAPQIASIKSRLKIQQTLTLTTVTAIVIFACLFFLQAAPFGITLVATTVMTIAIQIFCAYKIPSYSEPYLFLRNVELKVII